MNTIMRFIHKIKQSNIIKNVGLGFAFKLASVLLSFMYVPICRGYLGDLRYGIWATISSIVSWITLSDIGIGHGLRNRLTEAIARDDKDEAQGLVSTAYTIMLVICIALFTIYIGLNNSIDICSIFNINIVGDNSNLALTITVGFMCINFWLGLVTAVLYANQKAAIPSGATVLDQIINIILIIIASRYIPVRLPVISLIVGFSTLITRLFLNFYVFSKYKYLRPKIKLYDKRLTRSIASFGILLFISQICTAIMNSTDNILISKYLGAENVTVYNTAFRVFQIFVTINGIIITPMWSAFTMHNEKMDYAWMKSSLRKMNQINYLISFGVILMAFLLPTFSDIWLQHHLDYDPLMICFMAAYTILMNYSCNYATLLNGVGDVKLSTTVAAVQAVLNIPLSIYLAVSCNLGLSGIIGGTLLVTIISFIVLPIKVHRWFIKHNNTKVTENAEKMF